MLAQDLQLSSTEFIVTPNGYVSMPVTLQQDFSSAVNGLGQASNSLSSDFQSLTSNIQRIENYVTIDDPNSGIVNYLFLFIFWFF